MGRGESKVESLKVESGECEFTTRFAYFASFVFKIRIFKQKIARGAKRDLAQRR